MFVFLIGILIDIFINNIKPLEGFDILYLLGISLPIAALAAKYSRNLIIALIVLILVTGTFLRNYFGYHDVVINDIDFTNSAIFPDKIPFHCWFIDGWFPIFPWLACMLSGVAFGKTYEMHNKDMSLFQDYKYLLGTIALFLVGIAFFITYPSEMIPRHGYIEIFYPLSIGLFISLVSFAFRTIQARSAPRR